MGPVREIDRVRARLSELAPNMDPDEIKSLSVYFTKMVDHINDFSMNDRIKKIRVHFFASLVQ
jgi:hypothetical protein